MKHLKLFVISISILTLLFSLSVYAQKESSNPFEDYKFGVIPVNDQIYNSLPKAPAILESDLLGLPAQVDLSSNFPTPGNQGQQGSCVAWASAYAYKTYQEKLEENWDISTNNHLFSPAFVYNSVVKGNDSGMYMHQGFEVIVAKGCATLQTMPYNDRDCGTQPNSSQLAEAIKYKAKSYGTVTQGDIESMKSYLANQTAVNIGIPIYDDFELSNNNPIYDKTTGQLYGYHAICLVGYDDSKQAFKFINSWGTGYGFNGYGWISYNLIKSENIEGYILVDQKNNNDDDPDDNTTIDYSVNYRTLSKTQNSFRGEFTIQNTGKIDIKNWQLSFNLKHSITELTSAKIVSQTGTTYVTQCLDPNAAIKPGEIIKVEFNATRSGSIKKPTNMVLSVIK